MAKPAKIVRWENPPPARAISGHRRSKWAPVADVLRDEPRRWAVVYEGPQSTAAGLAAVIRNATVACFAPRGSFQSVTRAAERNGEITVYARFLGDGGPW